MRSLLCLDTPAKEQVWAIANGEHLERWPEPSHLWEVGGFDEPTLKCKLRPDFVVRFPRGIFGVQIKSTSKPVGPASWWPMWKRQYLTSAAFHAEGLRDWFGELCPRGVPQLWVVASLEAPFPWAIYDLSNPEVGRDYLYGQSAPELIESEWLRLLRGPLAQIHESHRHRRAYGPEEGGIA